MIRQIKQSPGALIGALIAFFLSFQLIGFLSVVIGGTAGGAIIDIYNMCDSGVLCLFGAFVGMIIVFLALETFVIMTGACAGYLIEKFLKNL